MTNYTITPSNSRHTTNPSQHAFERDSSGPDALVVQEGAFLTASGISAFGARLAGTGAWTVRIDGSVVSQKSAGLVLDSGITTGSTIVVGSDGTVGGQAGMILNSPTVLRNAGTISGPDGDAINLNGRVSSLSRTRG
jgi:hypothetical protein